MYACEAVYAVVWKAVVAVAAGKGKGRTRFTPDSALRRNLLDE